MNSLSQPIARYLLLCFSTYVFLFIFPFPAKYFPFGEELANATYGRLMTWISEWVAYTLLGLKDMNYQGGYGSGDTTYDYVQLLTKALLSVLIAVGLLFFGKGISWISQPFVPIRVYARYFVGITLITYGIAKFWGGQFPSPSLGSMVQEYGDSSPMGLAWRFFGYSDLYKLFMGVSEIAAGGLLLFRRTVVVGALLSVAVTFNVFLVNMSFDVPVKILSGHLLLFSMLILGPYLQQLTAILLYRREGHLPFEPLHFSSNKYRWVYRMAKGYLVVLVPLGLMVGQYLRKDKSESDGLWDGAYKVTEFAVTGEPVEDIIDVLVIDRNSLQVRQKSGTLMYFSTGEIEEDGSIHVNGYDQDEDSGRLRLAQDGEEHYISWEMGESILSMRAIRKVKSDYFLVKRGFHWINEFPVNR